MKNTKKSSIVLNSPYEVIYFHSQGMLDSYLALQRANVKMVRQCLYRQIPEKALEVMVSALESNRITINAAALINMFALFPEERVILFTEDWREIAETALRVVSQYYLGCDWPDSSTGHKTMLTFAELLNHEMRNFQHCDLDKPHSYA